KQLLAVSFQDVWPGEERQSSGGLVMCMIQLEHTDAEELAAVLKPFLSPAGSIAPYRPTNTLIIRDRALVVEQLSTVIKGKPCVSISEQSEVETGDQQEQSHLDQ
ncbi:MAG: secretin N-terminal domain-containing protein, partial [Desulfobacterales bacterium]